MHSWGGVGCGSAPDELEPAHIALNLEVRSPGELAAELLRRQDAVRRFFDERLARLDIQETTVTDSGRVVDWLPRREPVAPPPPPPPHRPLEEGEAYAKTELQTQPHARGPDGTVPRFRFDVETYLKWIGDNVPSDPELVGSTLPSPDPEANDRYYVRWRTTASAGGTQYWGGIGIINIWDAIDLVAGETNIAQIALARGTPTQTVEAGKIEAGFNGGAPTFFTYFTTNGNASTGDWVGGYNQIFDGWEQYSGSIAPGDAIDPDYYSSTGGNQYVWDVMVQHGFATNAWWVWANGEYIGFYPECRNDAPAPCPANNTYIFAAAGMRPKAERVSFYGEVFDSSAPAATITDMGSGLAASLGWQFAAYMRNMQVAPDGDQEAWQLFQSAPGSRTTLVTDVDCYDMSPRPPSTSGGTNRFYFGGDGDEVAGCN